MIASKSECYDNKIKLTVFAFYESKGNFNVENSECRALLYCGTFYRASIYYNLVIIYPH